MRIVLALIIAMVFYSCGEQEVKEGPEVVDSTAIESDSEQAESVEYEDSFEGQITYTLKFQAKGDANEFAALPEVFGDTLVVTHSKGRYIMQYINGKIEYIKYLRDNYQYRKMVWIDTLYFTDAVFEKANYYSGLKSATDSKVLGRDLNMVTITTDVFKKFYYYDSTLFIDPKYYRKHNLGYDNKYYELAESPFLYAEIVYDRLKVIMEAVKIEEKEIPERYFELPDLITKPSHELTGE